MIGAKGSNTALRESQFFPYPGCRQISLWTACAAGQPDNVQQEAVCRQFR